MLITLVQTFISAERAGGGGWKWMEGDGGRLCGREEETGNFWPGREICECIIFI